MPIFIDRGAPLKGPEISIKRLACVAGMPRKHCLQSGLQGMGIGGDDFP